MSLQAVLALVLYIAIMFLAGAACIYFASRYGPADLQALIRAGVVVICVLLVLMRLAGYV